MANIVTFRGGQIFNDRAGNPASIAAKGSQNEAVSLLLINTQEDSGVASAGNFSGHFQQAKFNAIVTLVRGNRLSITIAGTRADAPNSYRPIVYSSSR